MKVKTQPTVYKTKVVPHKNGWEIVTGLAANYITAKEAKLNQPGRNSASFNPGGVIVYHLEPEPPAEVLAATKALSLELLRKKINALRADLNGSTL